MRLILILQLIISFLTGCSADSNINQIFVAKRQKEAVDHLLQKAEILYDKGKFSEARWYAQKAYDINNDNEEAAVILAYIYLALAGIDTFQLAENLINQSNEGKKTNLAAAENAVDSLSELKGVIGLEDTDVEALTVEGNQVEVDGEIVKGVSDNPVFSGMDINLPKTASDARTSASIKLQNLANSVAIICPFVADAVKILEDDTHAGDDPRHSLENCQPSEIKARFRAKSHFLWALAHLTEAIAFNTLISNATATLTERGSAIEKSASNVSSADYVSGILELADVVNVIMPTDTENALASMITAIFNDLEATVAAFAQLPGIPDGITKTISTNLDKLLASSKSIQTAGKDSKATALKNQMVTKFSAKMRNEIKARENDFTTEEKDEACSAYKSITTEAFEVCP